MMDDEDFLVRKVGQNFNNFNRMSYIDFTFLSNFTYKKIMDEIKEQEKLKNE